MQLVEDSGLLPALETPPAGLTRTEPQLKGEQLPGDVVVQDVEDALQAQPVRHGPWTGSLLRPARQERLDQRPQVIVHDPRPGSHTIPNGRIVTPVTAYQDSSTRSCYELYGLVGQLSFDVEVSRVQPSDLGRLGWMSTILLVLTLSGRL